MPAEDQRTIVLTGATGHIGGALLPYLLGKGRRLRCLVRDAERADLGPDVDVIEGDLDDRDSLEQAFVEGCVAYFLVHALGAGTALEDEERTMAENFAAAAERAGVARIVYLGGLVDESDPDLSSHMASRVAVGQILRGSGVPTLEFRASIVIGAGSLSFELIRRLVDTLPLVVLPDWVDNLAQPIALADVVVYLAAAADTEIEGDRIFEIGGSDQISYRALIEAYAQAVGATHRTFAVPVPDAVAAAATRIAQPAAERLPGDAQEALKLLESLRHASVVRDEGARVFGIRPMGVEAAIAAALAGS